MLYLNLDILHKREVESGQSSPYPGRGLGHPDTVGRCRRMLIGSLGFRPRTGIPNRPAVGRVLSCLPLVSSRSVSSRLPSTHHGMIEKNNPGASGLWWNSRRGLDNINISLSLMTHHPDSVANIIRQFPPSKSCLQSLTNGICGNKKFLQRKIFTTFTKLYTSDFITKPPLIISELQRGLCSQRDHYFSEEKLLIFNYLPP